MSTQIEPTVSESPEIRRPDQSLPNCFTTPFGFNITHEPMPGNDQETLFTITHPELPGLVYADSNWRLCLCSALEAAARVLRRAIQAEQPTALSSAFSVQMNVRLPEEIALQLDMMAKQEGLSKSEIVRRALARSTPLLRNNEKKLLEALREADSKILERSKICERK